MSLELAARIIDFLEKYAKIRPDWDAVYDEEEDKFTSPDASMLKYCADMLYMDKKPLSCFSEWSSGGYGPYSSVEGREEHDTIVKEIYTIINS